MYQRLAHAVGVIFTVDIQSDLPSVSPGGAAPLLSILISPRISVGETFFETHLPGVEDIQLVASTPNASLFEGYNRASIEDYEVLKKELQECVFTIVNALDHIEQGTYFNS